MWICVDTGRIYAQTDKRLTGSANVAVQPTPANEHVDGEADGVVVDDEQQCVQVETLHQQQEEVGHDEVVEEHQGGLAAHLRQHASLHTCDDSPHTQMYR